MKNEQSTAISCLKRLITQDMTGPLRLERMFVGVNILARSKSNSVLRFSFRGRQPVLERVFDVGFGVDELLPALLSSVFVKLGGTGLVFLE